MTAYEDYLMLLSPPDAVKHEIARYKKASARLIGDYQSMDSPAHISILHLERQKPFMADRNIDLIEKSLNALPPILLHIDGFRYFGHLHNRMTIYAHIRSTPAVEEWFKRLKKSLNIKKALVPHITITRNIPGEDFTTLWPHFQHKQLVEPFWIKELKIVKRETFADDPKWQSFKVFEFKNSSGLGNRANVPLNKPAPTDMPPVNQIDLF